MKVKRALQKQGWSITDDPLILEIEEILVKIDLAAERLIGAERNGEKIAVEIKTFAGDSAIREFHFAQIVLRRYPLKLLIYEPVLEEILEWRN